MRPKPARWAPPGGADDGHVGPPLEVVSPRGGAPDTEEELDDEGQDLINKVIVGDAGPVPTKMRKEPPTRTCHDCGYTAIKNRMIKSRRREHAVMTVDSLSGEASVPEYQWICSGCELGAREKEMQDLTSLTSRQSGSKTSTTMRTRQGS